MEWDILLSIAFTIPLSSNIALTLTSSPSIPIRSISFSNGTLAFPTVYSSWQSIMSHESYMPETVVMWGLLFSPKPATIAAGNAFLFSPWDLGPDGRCLCCGSLAISLGVQRVDNDVMDLIVTRCRNVLERLV